MDTTDTGCETLLHNVVVSVATYRRRRHSRGWWQPRHSRWSTVAHCLLPLWTQWTIATTHWGTIATTSQSLRNSGRLLTVIPIAILGVTLRQHPRIGQLYRTAHCRLNIAHNILHTGYCTLNIAHSKVHTLASTLGGRRQILGLWVTVVG